MARRVTITNEVYVVGRIWMPSTIAAYTYTLSQYDLENIGELTRDNIEEWLTKNAGDFQSIIDFAASIGDIEIPWQNEDNEATFYDFMSE